MTARQLRIDVVSSSCTYVRGHGSRELLTELRGRPPIWAGDRRAWVTQESTARDLIAVAESRGYLVLLSSRGDAA